jgi:hypothetical protein
MASGATRVAWSLPPFAAVDGVVVAYALWTVAANLTVIGGGNAGTLTLALGASIVASAALLGVVLARADWRRAYSADLDDDPAAVDRMPARSRLRLSTLAVLLLALGVWLGTGNAWLTWGAVAVATVLAHLAARPETTGPHAEAEPPTWARFERIALYGLAILCALFTLASVRPRSDDTLYLSLAVSVADYPDRPVVSELTLHGPPTDVLGPQGMFPPYKAHSFELLGGVLSHLTGIEAVRIIHFGLATLCGFLVPFALARLLRILTPRHWLLALCGVLAFYVLEGSASRGYSNHALVRLFHGKSALLTIGLPLICAYGLRFGARPTKWRLALLASAQIAAMGLSSTGIWFAPVLAAASVVVATPARRLLPSRLLSSALSSAYVLAMAVWVLSQMQVGLVEPTEIDSASGRAASHPAPALFADLAEAIAIVLGPEPTAIALLGVALLAAPLAQTALASRFFAIFALLVACGFGNPVFSKWVTSYVTGGGNYHRIFWLLPVPIAFGSLCVSCYCELARRTAAMRALALTAAAVGLFFFAAVDRLVISADNGSKLALPPLLKLPRVAWAVSEEVCKLAPQGTYVLASQAVMQQLPIHHRCGHPLIAADRWIAASPEEIERRLHVTRYVDEAEDVALEDAVDFLDAVARYRIGVVVLSNEANRNSRAKSLIRMAGYEHLGVVEWEHVYVRTQPSRLEAFQRVVDSICELTQHDAAVLAPYGISRVLARKGCARPVASMTRFREASRFDAEEMLDLERLVHLERDLTKDRVDWFAGALDARKVRMIVLSAQAIGNDRVRGVLSKQGFKKARISENFTLYRRDLP